MKKKLRCIILGGLATLLFIPHVRGAAYHTYQMKPDTKKEFPLELEKNIRTNEPWVIPTLYYKTSAPTASLVLPVRKSGQVKKIRMTHTTESPLIPTRTSSRLSDKANQIYLDTEGNYMYVTGEFNLLSLYSLTGSIVMRTRENITDVRHLSSGIYLAKIDLKDQQSITRKLVKK